MALTCVRRVVDELATALECRERAAGGASDHVS